MKNFILLIFFSIIGFQALMAQSPAFFNYQAVPRKQDSLLYSTGQILRFRFQIRESSSNGNIVFAETSNLTVNRQGAVNAAIGMGAAINGVPHDLALVNWSIYNYYLSVSVDVNNNGSFEANENFGTTQLLSVPYAMYAAQSGGGGGGSDDQTLSLSGNTLSITNGNTVNLPTYQAGDGIYINGQTINAYDESATNEIQTLSITGNQLKISQGNTVTLPSGGGGGSSYWTSAGGNDIQYINNGTVFVGGSIPFQAIFASANNGSATIVAQQNGGGTALQASNTTGGNSAEFTGRVMIDGNFSQYALLVENGEAGFPDGLTVGNSNRLEYSGINQLEISSTFSPTSDNYFNLGKSSQRWGAVYAANGTINTSDATLKRDIKPLTYGIDQVMQLQPVSYAWMDGRLGEGRHIGFLAQDLQKIVPEVVWDKEWVYEKEDRSDAHWQPAAKLGVAYSEIIPVTVAAIQQQQAMIELLQQQNAALLKRIEVLEKN